MILYPTETLYAVGVHALDADELAKLYALKERDRSKAASWLVRNVEDILNYAEVGSDALKIAERFLPGSLTLVLKALPHVQDEFLASDRTIGFRISSDPIAQELIAEFMQIYNAPLTCTSANVSGAPTLPTVGEILQQFGPRASMIDRVIDDGPRKGLASTIVRAVGTELTILREGEITQQHVHNLLRG
jgi:L-threonylcarbamoyladenylate synthase